MVSLVNHTIYMYDLDFSCTLFLNFLIDIYSQQARGHMKSKL